MCLTADNVDSEERRVAINDVRVVRVHRSIDNHFRLPGWTDARVLLSQLRRRRRLTKKNLEKKGAIRSPVS